MESYVPIGVVGFENFQTETLVFIEQQLGKPITQLSIPELDTFSHHTPPVVASLVACIPHAHIPQAVALREAHLREASQHAIEMMLPDETEVTFAQVGAVFSPSIAQAQLYIPVVRDIFPF